MTTATRLLCLGYGYTARAFAALLREEGWRIAGTTTSPEKAGTMEKEGVAAHLWRDGAFDPALV